MNCWVGWGSVVGIVTGYRLDDLGLESWWGEIFCTCPDSLRYSGYRVSFPGIKHLGCGINHLSSSSYEVKEIVEPYLYSPSGPSCTLKFTLTLPWTFRTFPQGNTTSVFQQVTFSLVEIANAIWMGSCHMDQSVKLR
jgi:hypothetical protein